MATPDPSTSPTAGDAFAAVKLNKSPAVVTIETTYPRNFGIDSAGSSQATGFVVDKAKGIILTNKHVVQEGPCRAKARFMKNEEIDLVPIYRDPVHDFGFFTFKPELVTQTDLQEIELDPTGAVRGKNTLIIGNNGGERLSYVETTVARTDRPPVPMLDLNTFYITASDTGVGGSSGAPMLSSEGKAVAMVAAGNDGTNISMYLPLFRVERALEFIRKGDSIPRGTLQVGLKHKTFDALLKRKEITSDTVSKVKEAFSDAEGVLVVEKNLPKGPGREAGIKNGDVLLKVNNALVHTFIQLESVLDTFVGKEVTLTVIREGAEVILKPVVQDFNEITNQRFVEVSNGIFHGIQYLVAMYMNLPMEGVFVAKQGYMFSNCPQLSIVKRIGQKPIHNLDDFIAAVQELPNGDLVPVRYQPIHDQNKQEITTVTVDKRWYPFLLATRNDAIGQWDFKDLLVASKKKQVEAKLDTTKVKTEAQSSGERSSGSESVLDKMAKYIGALVKVRVSIPFTIDGRDGAGGSSMESGAAVSCGVILDKRLGLVMTDKNVVETTLADVQLVFDESVTVPAKVLFVHPEKPFSFLQYDPTLLNNYSISVSEVKLSSVRPKIGETLIYAGVKMSFQAELAEAKVASFRDVNPYGGDFMGHTSSPGPTEVVGFSIGVNFGVFLDKDDASVKAFAVCYMTKGFASLSSELVDLVEVLQNAISTDSPVPGSVSMLPITTSFISMAKARVLGLPEEWASKLHGSMTMYQKKLITVKRRMVTEDVFDKFLENDIILTVDGTPVTLIRDFYDLISSKEKVKFQLFRDHEVIEVEVATTVFSTVGTKRIFHFAGLILQQPHSAIHFLSKPEILQNGGVYVNNQEPGSPAEASLMAHEDRTMTNSLVKKLVFKVDGVPVKNLDDFVAVTRKKKHNDFVRLMAKDIMHGEESVHDIRLDLEYWKSRDMFLDDGSNWVSKIVEHDG